MIKDSLISGGKNVADLYEPRDVREPADQLFYRCTHGGEMSRWPSTTKGILHNSGPQHFAVGSPQSIGVEDILCPVEA